jgi:hypothetical protein
MQFLTDDQVSLLEESLELMVLKIVKGNAPNKLKRLLAVAELQVAIKECDSISLLPEPHVQARDAQVEIVSGAGRRGLGPLIKGFKNEALPEECCGARRMGEADGNYMQCALPKGHEGEHAYT